MGLVCAKNKVFDFKSLVRIFFRIKVTLSAPMITALNAIFNPSSLASWMIFLTLIASFSFLPVGNSALADTQSTKAATNGRSHGLTKKPVARRFSKRSLPFGMNIKVVTKKRTTKQVPLVFYRALGEESFHHFRESYFSHQALWTAEDVEDLGLRWMNQSIKDKNLSINLEAYQFSQLLSAINLALGQYEKDRAMMSSLKLRASYQDLFSGLMRAVQIASHFNIGLNRDSYLKLTDQIYSQTLEIFDSSARNYSFRDLYWDYQYLRALQFPTDLTRIHVERLVRQEDPFPADKKLYAGWAAALSVLALEKDHFIRLNQSSQTEFLYRQAYGYYSNSMDLVSLKKLQKAYLRTQVKEGAQEQVYGIRCELARQQILFVFEQTKKNFSFTKLFQLINLSIGYVFVALPLEFILLFLASLVLWYQGRNSLSPEERKASNFAHTTWIMFTRSYTGTNVNFYSKLASSLILFGIGLYFNSAKNLLEVLISNP